MIEKEEKINNSFRKEEEVNISQTLSLTDLI
jgi:hypothetical protein